MSGAITIAFATENHDYDAKIYVELLQQILARAVTAWNGGMRIPGRQAFPNYLPLFLDRAQQDGVRLALIAVDNDGGAARRLDHLDTHVPSDECPDVAAVNRACTHCWLTNLVLPRCAAWSGADGKHCLVVPVQLLETWLLVARAHTFECPSPEQRYHRDALKKDFFGDLNLPVAQRLAMALGVLRDPEALARMRVLQSFRRFERDALVAFT